MGRSLADQGTELLESDNSLSEISDVEASSMPLPDSSEEETVLGLGFEGLEFRGLGPRV